MFEHSRWRAPAFAHPCTTRNLFRLQGQGLLLLKNEDTRLIEQNNAVYIPENALHGVRNTGDVDLKLLWVFPTDSWNDVAYDFNK